MRCYFCGCQADTVFCTARCEKKYNASVSADRRLVDDRGQLYMNSEKTVLSLCDYTGTWSDPYRRAGYNVVMVDLKHGQDIRLLKYPGRVYGILAAPPCTHLARSGARWWASKGESAILEAMSIFDACCRLALFSKPVFWCFENPAGRLQDYVGSPAFRFDPCDYGSYGENYTKRTCLWGEFNMPLPENSLEPIQSTRSQHSIDAYMDVHGDRLWPDLDRRARRSVTPRGFSEAFYKVNR